MIKKTSLFFVFLLLNFLAFSQKGTIKGTIRDNITGESLIGATVLIAKGVGVITDLDGKFSIEADYGEYTLSISYVGFQPITQKITLDRKVLLLRDFKLKPTTLTEVQVVADVAIDRETPVAFSNILPAKIEEELASQDIPMILNTTPGVYATQQGGGDGDARITIRGFSQRNIAVMIDGIPVNDMENGWVYWSNWFGLDMVTRSIQVQRGLGASKIAIPSVGGTLNILTKGIDAKKGTSIKQEVGNDGFLRTTLGLTSGRLKNGWGFTFAGSYKKGNGWVDQTFTEGWFYYAKIEKSLGKHLIGLSVMGAPQKHGQRPYTLPITRYDKEYAKDIFKGSDKAYDIFLANSQGEIDNQTFYNQLSQIGVDSLQSVELSRNFVDTTGSSNYGLKYNQHWGYLERYTINDNGDTIRADKEILHEKTNYYHKPQFALKDFWTVSDKLYISNIVYLSVGRGGGTGARPGIKNYIDGQIDFQDLYNVNIFGKSPPFLTAVFPTYHPTEHKSTGILRSSVNNHFWYGLLSTASYVMNEKITISGGIDLRSYKGEHYMEVYDLLGGDYFVSTDDKTTTDSRFDVATLTYVNPQSMMKRVKDKISYYNDALVRWGGMFGQVEFKKDKWSTFLNLSGIYTGYKRIDYFKKKDLELSDTTYVESMGYNDTIIHNGETYTIKSSEARYTQTDWKWLPGFTVKGGANYNINEFHNVFMNVGYLSKTPKFQNVIDYSNRYVKDVKNEIITAVELGYSFNHKKIAINFNNYITKWENKPETKSYYDTDIGENILVNINGMEALHRGTELDAAYKLTSNFQVEGLLSIGDWRWLSGDSGIVYNDSQDSIGRYSFDATGVHVGNAAQTQIAGSIRYEVIKDLYLKGRITYFRRYYADFNPFILDGANERRDSWEIPHYYLVDFHGGYHFKYKFIKFNLRFSILNIFDFIYISDADNGGKFDAGTASVFFGMGRRFNTSLKITL